MNQRANENLWKPSSPTNGPVPERLKSIRQLVGSQNMGHGAPSFTPPIVFTRIEIGSPITPSSISALARSKAG